MAKTQQPVDIAQLPSREGYYFERYDTRRGLRERVAYRLASRAIEWAMRDDKQERMYHLDRIPTYGLNATYKQQLIKQILATGMPVHNLVALGVGTSQPDPDQEAPRFGGRINHLYNSPKAAFTVGEGYAQLSREDQKRVVVHELAHANTPLRWSNRSTYGTNTLRRCVEHEVQRLADTALTSGVFLDSYHEKIADLYLQGKRTRGEYHDETWAIWVEMGICDRDALAAVQDQQVARLAEQGQLRRHIDLITRPGDRRRRGIDQHLNYLLGRFKLPELPQRLEAIDQQFAAIDVTTASPQPSPSAESLVYGMLGDLVRHYAARDLAE